MTETRHNLLSTLNEFLPSLEALKCIKQIGLIGSITTPKPKPKDIDVIVCTAVGSDLSELATIYRIILGRLQSLGTGIDIFIFEEDSYIGRACRYRECWPRASCNANHCGRRPYLCDDLKVVNLSSITLSNLPVLLFPKVLCRDDVPKDIKHFVKGVKTSNSLSL